MYEHPTPQDQNDPAFVAALLERVAALEARAADPSATAKTEQRGPHITLTTVPAYAWCPRIDCDGNDQVPATAVRELAQWTFWMLGNEDGPLGKTVANEFVTYRFADPTERPCPHCHGHREIDEQARPVYERLSGFNPDGLRRLRALGVTWDEQKQRDLSLVTAAVGGAPAAKDTPVEKLQYAFIEGKVTEEEYRDRLAVLEGHVADIGDVVEELPTGIRRKGDKFQASWRDSTGAQKGPTFDTLDEAVAARDAGIAEREASD
jgi:hypothetical protein